MDHNDIDYMTSSYKMLYEIETALRDNIHETLLQNYGLNWQRNLRINHDLTKTLFHELISFYGKYPPLTKVFTNSERSQLFRIVSVRNKIAHMILISCEEYILLENCKNLVRLVVAKTKKTTVD